jgi:hypothetical protein
VASCHQTLKIPDPQHRCFQGYATHIRGAGCQLFSGDPATASQPCHRQMGARRAGPSSQSYKTLQGNTVQFSSASDSAVSKNEHPALQKMKFIKFFQCLWVIFALLDPDCESGSGCNGVMDLYPDPNSQSGSREGKKMTHKHWKKFYKFHFLKCWMFFFED